MAGDASRRTVDHAFEPRHDRPGAGRDPIKSLEQCFEIMMEHSSGATLRERCGAAIEALRAAAWPP